MIMSHIDGPAGKGGPSGAQAWGTSGPFVKELTLKGIKQISTANQPLLNGFLDSLNKKFAIQPAAPEDYHQPVARGLDLRDVFCFEEPRVLQKDWTIRYNNEYYQILE